jgi:4-amino-4-deoxy-L-arabinose transferase-like glycosyltransferase
MLESPDSSPEILSRRAANAVAIALLAVFAVLLLTSVRQQSQTFDESTHLFAGFAYWKHGDFGRNPEHPPLVKLVAALPLLPMHLQEPPPVPFPYFKGQDVINGVQLLYSRDGDAMLFRSRLMVAVFSFALAVLVFATAKEMFSPLAACLALFLFTFEPNVLANGALITTDMGLACLLFASVYTFYRYCKQPSAWRLALCALLALLTMVAKHSGVLVLPVLVLLALADAFLPAVAGSGVVAARGARLGRLGLALLVIFAVCYVGVWAFYGFRYAARPGQLQIAPPLHMYARYLQHPLQRKVIEFLAVHHLLPEAYLYGWLDILMISSTRPTFILGRLFPAGQWFFMPCVFLLKTTIPLLVFLGLVPFMRIWKRRREFIFLALPVGLFGLIAMVSLINVGVRYLVPIYPFCMVMAGAAAAALFARSRAGSIAVAALMLFTVISSLHAYPNFLAYSNEFAGGPAKTYRVATDSNADWGQGLKWTKAYLDRHPDPHCWFDYYGNPMVQPSFYGIPCKPLLSGAEHLFGAGSAPIPTSISGTVLISSTDLDGLLWGPGTLNPYRVFRNRTPDAVIGNVIFVYRGTFDVSDLAGETNALGAYGLLRQGRVPEALALAQTAVQQAPGSAEAQAALGAVLTASGKLPDGRQAIGTALRLAKGNHPEYQTFLIMQLEHPQGFGN